MENQELLLLELEEFDRSNQTDKQHIPQPLESFIEYVSKTGTYIFPWSKIKKLYLTKVNESIEHFSQSSSIDSIPNFDNAQYNELKGRILDRIKSFINAPFTIQRISELLLKPQCNYTRLDKFMRGLEKCVMVVTTIDPLGNKIFTETMVNGSSNETSFLNGDLYEKTSSSSVFMESTAERFKLIKQSKIDYNEIETKLVPSENCTDETRVSSIEDIELKIESQETEATVKKEKDEEEKKVTSTVESSNGEDLKIEETPESTTEKRISGDESISTKDSCENNIELNEEKERRNSSDEAMDN